MYVIIRFKKSASDYWNANKLKDACRVGELVCIRCDIKPNDRTRTHMCRSPMYMHSGQRDCTRCESGRDRVTRDTGRGTMDSTVSESDWPIYHQICVVCEPDRLPYHQSGIYVSLH